MRRILTFLAGLALASGSAACGAQVAEFCDAYCDCENCSGDEYDECVIEYEAEQDIASAYGCSDKFDDRHFCVIDRYSCNGDDFDGAVISCLDDYADYEDCRRDNSSL
jgi:hypothetical protein